MKSTHRLTLLATIFGSGIVFLDGTVVNLSAPEHIEGFRGQFFSSYSGLPTVICYPSLL
jgi:hypothetical protein